MFGGRELRILTCLLQILLLFCYVIRYLRDSKVFCSWINVDFDYLSGKQLVRYDFIDSLEVSDVHVEQVAKLQYGIVRLTLVESEFRLAFGSIVCT